MISKWRKVMWYRCCVLLKGKVGIRREKRRSLTSYTSSDINFIFVCQVKNEMCNTSHCIFD